MILTTHILSGAALGANIQNPYLVAASAIALHFFLDTLPHGDYLNKKSKAREFWKVAVDLAIGLGTVFSILFLKDPVPKNIFNVGIGIFFSLLPDGTTFLYWEMGMKFLRPLKKFHERLHLYPDFSPERQFRIKNNLWDIILSLLCALLLFIL